MKKAIKINISGVIFHIDEDAYEKLRKYLDNVTLYFENREGGREIVQDIEARIAELLQDRVKEHKQVVTISDVEEVVAIMGDPSDFAEETEDEGETSEEGQTAAEKAPPRRSRRLYRDPDNSVLGGVCGGLGSYLGIDPVILRIIFVILLIVGHGVWGLVYLVLWIAIPKATTIAQKLEMKGEQVNISNIEKRVKEEYEDVKSNIKNIHKTKTYRETTNVVNEIFSVLGKILLVVLKVIVVVLGFVFIFAGFALLMSFLGIFFFKSAIFPVTAIDGTVFPFSFALQTISEPFPSFILLTSLFLVFTIPLVALIYGGIKLIFNFKARDRGIGVAALLIWIVSLVMLLTFGAMEVRKYTSHSELSDSYVFEELPSQTLYLEVGEEVDDDLLTRHISFDQPFRGFFIGKHEDTYYGSVQLSIRRSRGENPELSVKREARGSSRFQSDRNAENIIYKWSQEDSTLVLDSFYKIPEGRGWNFSTLSLSLNIPEGQSIYIDEKMDRIITSARTAERVRIGDMTGKRWIMTSEGLKLYDEAQLN